MSWNEPDDRGDKNKKKDPWSRQEEQTPPNIDEALRQLQQKLRSLFGGKEKSSGTGFARQANTSSGSRFSFWLIGVIVFFVYIGSGFFIVQEAEEAVIQRFGRYIRTEGPGLHWIAPFVETKHVLNVLKVMTSKRGGPMLTKDENIVNAEITVHYRIGNARDYLFNLVQPVNTLEQVSDSALRSVVGQSTLDEVLTIGRSVIGAEISKQIQRILNNYHSGFEISDVTVQQTKAPEEVKAAFDDAIKAQQDEKRLENEARAYAAKVVPVAQGYGKRIVEEAVAYKERVVLEAEGKTAQFSKILPEYQRAPEVTRQRLYMDTLQAVYSNTAKVLIDTNSGNNVIYLPLDKLVDQKALHHPTAATLQPKEETPRVSAPEVTQEAAPLPRRMLRRPSYDDLERAGQGGE